MPAFDAPSDYLFVSAREPVGAAEAVSRWASGPPDLCVTGPSAEARETGVFACAGHFVRVIEEPLLAGRSGTDSAADFFDRFAEALRIVLAFDASAVLVVCDDLPPEWETPLALDTARVRMLAARIDRVVPLP